MSWDPAHLTVALVLAVACGALGALAPRLVGSLPEPVPDEPEAAEEVDGDEQQLFTRGLPAPPPKELYVDIAARPRFALTVVLLSAVVGAAVGLSLGWTGALVYLAPLVPVGVV